MQIKIFSLWASLAVLLVSSCTKSSMIDSGSESEGLVNSKVEINISSKKVPSEWKLKLEGESFESNSKSTAVSKRLLFDWLDDLYQDPNGYNLSISYLEGIEYLAEYTFARKPSGSLLLNAQAKLVRGPADEVAGGSHFGSFVEYQNPPTGYSVSWTENTSLCGALLVGDELNHYVTGEVFLWGGLPIAESQRVLISSVTFK